MATFVVIPTSLAVSTLAATVSEKFGNKAYRLPLGQWLVSYDGTSKQLSEHLPIETNEPAVILNFHGYYGIADPSIWEWLAVNASNS